MEATVTIRIPLVPVESSQIESVGHDPKDNTLYVKFKRGGTYEYQNVTKELHDQMMAAPSIGSWFSANIKKNPAAYPYKPLQQTGPFGPSLL